MFRTADQGAAVGRIGLTASQKLRLALLRPLPIRQFIRPVPRRQGSPSAPFALRLHTKRRSRRGSLIIMTTASRATWKAIGGLSALLAAASLTHAQAPPAFTVISPIYGQLVRFSMPPNFVVVYENAKDGNYIREAVRKGETVQAWTQMITVTGAKGLAGNRQVTPESFAVSIAAGFKKACPDIFDANPIGATRFGDRDGFVAVAGCGALRAARTSAARPC